MALIAGFIVSPTFGAVWPENHVSDAVITDHGQSAQLADVDVKPAPAWSATVGDVAGKLELAWPSPIRFDTIACRWRRPPADYTISIKSDTTWQEIVRVTAAQIPIDKIHLHILGKYQTNALRIRVTKPTGTDDTCSLDALEIYDRSNLPTPITNFLNRPTPRFGSSPDAMRQARAKNVSKNTETELDRELLETPIPMWIPITDQQYSGKPAGQRINQISARRKGLLSAAAQQYFNTAKREYLEKAWEVFAVSIDHYDRYQGFRFIGDCQSVTFQEPGSHIPFHISVYDRLAEGLTLERRLRVLYHLLDLGDFQYDAIRTIPSIWNPVPDSIGALALLAWYLGPMPECDDWLAECDRAIPRFFQIAPKLYLEDGMWWECSPGHHYYVLKGLHRYAVAKHLLGDPIWTRRFGKLSLIDIVEPFAKMVNPLGEWPSINDSSGHGFLLNKLAPLRQIATLAGRGDWLHAWHAQPSIPKYPPFASFKPPPIREPDYRSVLLPASGLAIMRDGWERNDSYLLLDYGPSGGGHGHDDKLNIILVADGRHWIPDASNSPHYSIFPEQKWHKQTVAHNTVLVDNKSQERCTGQLVRWHTQDELDVVTAEYKECYMTVTKVNGKNKETPAIHHRRTVLHPRREYFLIHDIVESLDGHQHDVEAIFHVYGQFTGQQPGHLQFEADTKTLQFLSPDIKTKPMTMEKSLCGGLEKEKQKAPGYSKKGGPGWIYIPFFRLKKTVTANQPVQHFWTVIVPTSAKWKPRTVELLADNANPIAIKISGPDTTDIVVDIVVEPGIDNPSTYQIDALNTDAPLIYLRTRNGNLQSSHCFAGSTATWNGKTLPLTSKAAP